MHLLIINNKGVAAKSIKLSTLLISLSLLAIITVFLAIQGNAWINSSLNTHAIHQQASEEIMIKTSHETNETFISNLLEQDRIIVNRLENNLDAQLELLNLQLAQMQTQLIRMETLGDKLIVQNKLDPKIFNFSETQSIGGPVEETENTSNKIDLTAINQRFNSIAKEIKNKSEQLYIFEAIYDKKYLHQQTYPTGKPSEKGWVSSYFGKRKDPFTGKLSQHKGVDVAGPSGSNIIATAKGIITWAGKRSGYGQLIEIDHGNNLITRYGHCKSITVDVGQIVNQGQTIGIVGSTGRSTGPHIHYEVIKNGTKLNPIKYVRYKKTATVNL